MPIKTKFELKLGAATREAFGKTLVELGRENPNVVAVDADLSKSTYTHLFAKEFPQRFFSCGIAEANMVSQAHGWARYCAIEQRHTYLRPRHGVDFGPQIPVNEDLKDYCRSHGITLIAYSILLQGAYTREERPIPAQYAGPDADARLQVLKAVASELGATLNQVIIAWMAQSDPPVLPIIAGSRPEQLTENIAALDVTLTADQMSRLNTAGNAEIKQAWLR